jgi:hypothetical protein
MKFTLVMYVMFAVVTMLLIRLLWDPVPGQLDRLQLIRLTMKNPLHLEDVHLLSFLYP